MNKRSGNALSPVGNLLTVIIALAIVLPVACAHAQTIDDYLQQAAQNNPGLKAMYAEYEAAVQRIAQAKGWSDPMLSVSAFGEMVETRLGGQSATFSIEQQFPWFGTLKAKGDESALMAEAGLKRFHDARNELYYKVKSAYYPIVETAQRIDLNLDNLDILNIYKSLATARFSNGEGTMVDVLRIEIMIDQLSAEIKILERQRQSLESVFNALLNSESDQPVVVPDTLFLPQVSVEHWEDSLINNPRVTAQEKLLEAAQTRQKVARKEGMPMLGLGFNYVVIDPMPGMDQPENGRDAYMPMFSVSLPVYRKKYKAAEKEAELMQSYYRSSRQEELNNLRGEFAIARSTVENAREQHESLHHHVMLTNQTIRLLLTAVENSEQSYAEILRMQQELIMHESDRLKIVAEAWQALAKLEYLAAREIQ